tara:strand:- start:23 stop:649 length:627 start_codon:yes stop_codon:yes gene_type:complete
MSKSSQSTLNNEKNDNIILEVLQTIDTDNHLTQRSMSTKLGIALGMANTYLKRCVDKGLVKIQHAPRNRYMYYLTPKGFAEKARLTGEYLRHSFNFYRKAKHEYSKIIYNLQKQGLTKVVLSDVSELAEIFIMSSYEMPINILGILGSSQKKYFGITVIKKISDINDYDVIVMTTINNFEEKYNEIITDCKTEKIIIPEILNNFKKGI